MKNVKKLLVVLPLVLVFVISSLPVFAWIGKDVDVKITLKTAEGLSETLTFKGKDFPESEFKENGIVSPAKLVAFLKEKSSLMSGKNCNCIPYELAEDVDLKDLASNIAGDPSKAVTAEYNLKKPEPAKPEPEKPADKHPEKYTILAFDILNWTIIPTRIHDIENKSNVKSIRDMAEEFFKFESMRSGILADYYMVGFEPVAGDGYAKYADIQASTNVDIICLVAPKLVPLRVLHIFPDRSDLFETIMVDYYALYGDDCQINSWNAAEIAKTRIQKVNEMGYVFDRAEFQKAKFVESYIREARDIWGQIIPSARILQDNPNLLLIYYKNAPAPVAAPATDPNKRVDAVSAQKTDANVTANLQPNANVQAPVTADAQLPATGAADNAFLFLSSAALMALGTFFFKKH